MISAALITLLMFSQQPPQVVPQPAAEFSELIVRRRIIIRVPTKTGPMATPVRRWKERKGPKCIAGRGIAGAILVSLERVDFILPGGGRVRAELKSSCPALDFYNGFYLRPDPTDGMICADRDAIHARSGGECQIRRFRQLLPR